MPNIILIVMKYNTRSPVWLSAVYLVVLLSRHWVQVWMLWVSTPQLSLTFQSQIRMPPVVDTILAACWQRHRVWEVCYRPL